MSQDIPDIKGYSKDALEMLTRASVTIGDRITVRAHDRQLSGILMPRYESADKSHIVIKLSSGYNVGIEISKIESISKEVQLSNQEPTSNSSIATSDKARSNFEFISEKIQKPWAVEQDRRDLPKIALISTWRDYCK